MLNLSQNHHLTDRTLELISGDEEKRNLLINKVIRQDAKLCMSIRHQFHFLLSIPNSTLPKTPRDSSFLYTIQHETLYTVQHETCSTLCFFFFQGSKRCYT